MEQITDEDRLLTVDDVARRVGLSANYLRTLVRRGDFPPPTNITPNRVGWLSSTVTQWIRERVEQSSADTHAERRRVLARKAIAARWAKP